MKNNMITIIKKEFARFFKDKRMVFSILMPGILIYVLYTFMGQAFMNQYTVDDNYKSKVYIYNEPSSLEASLDKMSIKELSTSGKDVKEVKQKVKDKKCDLVVVFPKDFDKNVSEFCDNNKTIPTNVKIYYNSSRTESQAAYTDMVSLLDNYKSSLANVFDVNGGKANYDLASDEDVMAKLLAGMLPLLMIVFIFSGCLAIAPESIAGEKERGTIATLLVTPMKRSQLALGKIISLSVLGLLSGVSSFLGTILSLPKMMMGGEAGKKLSVSVYSTSDYVILLLVILSTVLVIVSLMSIISAYAKTIKEATSLIVPLNIVVMLVALTAMFGDGAKKAFYWYLIPLYNSVQSMYGIFGFTATTSNLIITIVANVVFALLLTFGLTKMFESEKVMFSK